MNLAKSYDFFKPEDCASRIHIIGCGAIGSTVAENLVRLGLTKITLYDFDIVESHNIANQMFRQIDIGKTKVEALAEILSDINPDVKSELQIKPKGYTGQKLAGYIFLCVDNIELRREIVEKYKDNRFVKAVFDFRMGLTNAQHYAADWRDKKMIESLLKTMDFSHAEAQAETPVSACNLTLSVVPTVRDIVAHGIFNFMNFIKTGKLSKYIWVEASAHEIDAF